jgi:hypothetical protein
MEEEKISKSSMGKKSRAAGARFELKVRKDLEEKGWITDKWTKNVDLEKMELVPTRRKFIPGKGFLGIGTGFPDFIAFRPVVDTEEKKKFYNYNVIGVESKMNGILEKKEKEKCEFLLERGIFKNILIARKGEKKGSIEYIDFVTKELRDVF